MVYGVVRDLQLRKDIRHETKPSKLRLELASFFVYRTMDYSEIPNSELQKLHNEMISKMLEYEDGYNSKHNQVLELENQVEALKKEIDCLSFDDYENMSEEAYDIFEELEYRKINRIHIYSIEDLELSGQLKMEFF